LEALARSILDDAAETPEQDHFPHDLMSIVEPGTTLSRCSQCLLSLSLKCASELHGFLTEHENGQIAAIASIHQMSVATRDIGDFQASGIPLVNPWE